MANNIASIPLTVHTPLAVATGFRLRYMIDNWRASREYGNAEDMTFWSEEIQKLIDARRWLMDTPITWETA